jgi:MoaA/NifB/PqqE/SkfB family radical SAM enzyme
MLMLSNPKDKEKLEAGIKELSNSMTRVDAEKDFQKDAIGNLADELGIKKQYIAKIAQVYHKQTFVKMQAEHEEIEELYESVFK